MAPKILIPAEKLPEIVHKMGLASEADKSRRECTLEELARQSGISRRTLFSIRKRAELGPEHLLRRSEKPPGPTPKLDQRAVAWALAYKEVHPKAPLTKVHERMLEHASEFEVPSYAKLYRLFKNGFGELTSMMEEGHAEFFNSRVLKLRQSYGCVNQVWQIDATEASAYTVNLETGALSRPWLLSAIDGFSRVVIDTMSFPKTPTTLDLMLFLRHAFLAKKRPEHPFMGIPQVIIPDQHSIFKQPDFLAAMLQLGVRVDHAAVGAAQGKALVERWFKNVKEGFFTGLCSYTEKSNAMAKAKSAAIPYPVLQRLIDRYIAKYHVRTHGTLGLDPWSQWHDNLETAHRVQVDVAEVMSALKQRSDATVRTSGIELEDGQHYIAPELTGYVGKKVTLLRPLRLGESPVFVYYKGQFVCEVRGAESNPDFARKTADARMARIDVLREIRRDLRESVKLTNVETPGADPREFTTPNRKAAKSPAKKRRGGGRVPKFKTDA